ncbi:HAD family hydrolase [Natronolimnohabitans innermongolicus]|uniref:HAD-superfamily hydrolase n=1 Tax=Natronolimnohabitans innermongolicus JCM 12255 TaxID=1227499 RepID=L9X7M4_9EURY|nr:HAD family hydrolase [Natronolimnohabitans innermongolicus]ELY57592.1 HAD-superfamily hydrolase [Natronolimnohabitans innermongolicus JCM 12255]
MPQAVVFDLDYTLAVPTRDRATILREATAAADAPALSREEYLDAHRRNLTRQSREPIFADLLDDRETDADPSAVADAYRETIAETLEPLPGVESMLAELRGEYRVGLLTNGPIRAQRDKLATLGWEDAFDAALVTGELEAGKPDRRAFEAILAELNVPAEEAVYVGDEVEADVRGATNTGIDAVQVLLEDGPAPDPRAVDHVEQSAIAAELPAIVAGLERDDP